MEISFIVPLFNHLKHTQAMLASLLASLPPGLDYEIILVDDFSTDGTRAWLATLGHPRIKVVLNPKNLAYAASNNAGARVASGELLALLNNDLLLAPGWLGPMVYVLRHPGLNAGIVGNVQYRVDDGRLDHTGVQLNHKGQFEHVRALPVHGLGYQKSLALTGACVLIRNADFSSTGGFDEGFVNGCEDYDLCFKIRKAGKQLFVATESEVRHHVSLSRGHHTLQDSRNSQRLYAKWRGFIKSNFAAELAKSMNFTPCILETNNNLTKLQGTSEKPNIVALKTAEDLLRKEESEWKRILSKLRL